MGKGMIVPPQWTCRVIRVLPITPKHETTWKTQDRKETRNAPNGKTTYTGTEAVGILHDLVGGIQHSSKAQSDQNTHKDLNIFVMHHFIRRFIMLGIACIVDPFVLVWIFVHGIVIEGNIGGIWIPFKGIIVRFLIPCILIFIFIVIISLIIISGGFNCWRIRVIIYGRRAGGWIRGYLCITVHSGWIGSSFFIRITLVNGWSR
mmetsp:Transcript_14944/g.27110  ORF Transcript_14944/g.27110 Transcript_14944/m.27110 type:complete len:204 (+) Transcript_14944:181-792(+)